MRAGLDVVRLNSSHGTRRGSPRGGSALVREAAARADSCVGRAARPGRTQDPHRELPRRQGACSQEGAGLHARHRRSIRRRAPRRRWASPTRTCRRTSSPGDTLLLNDGQIVLDVEQVDGTRIETRVRVGGELSDRKGLNRQGGGISAPAHVRQGSGGHPLRGRGAASTTWPSRSRAMRPTSSRRARWSRAGGRRCPHRGQDRAPRSGRQPGGHHRRHGRRHGGARRSRRRDGLRRADRPAEDDHPSDPRSAIAWSSPRRR